MRPSRVEDRRGRYVNFTLLVQWLGRNTDQLAVALILMFLVSGVATLKDYGLTWDEGLGNLLFGDRNFRFFTSLDFRYLNVYRDVPQILEPDLNLSLSPLRDFPLAFPAFADVPPTATKYIFSYWLKWLNPIDGFHLFPILLAAGFLWLLYRFCATRLGRFPALMAVLFLGTAPRFWGDMHFNVKDVPETVYLGATLMAYWMWREKPTWRRALATGLLMGSALGTKANAIFIPPILLASIVPWSFDHKAWLTFVQHMLKSLWHYALMAASAVAFYILSWPYLYANPIQGLRAYWGGVFRLASVGSVHWQIDPLRQVLTTMPEVMLFFLVIGLIVVLPRTVRSQDPLWRLLAVWLVVPILRVSIPTGVNFDGIRHFLEFLPAAAMIAGVGLDRTARWVEHMRWVPGVAARATGIGLLAANLIQIYVLFYPYVHIYYNQLTGGLHGAQDRFLGSKASDYWAGSYRQGMEWLDQHAPANSHVAALIAPWIVEISGPVLLRPDIHPVIGSLPDFSFMKTSGDPYYLMFIRGSGGTSADEIAYTKKRGALEYQIVVDQVTILQIYRFGGTS